MMVLGIVIEVAIDPETFCLKAHSQSEHYPHHIHVWYGSYELVCQVMLRFHQVRNSSSFRLF